MKTILHTQKTYILALLLVSTLLGNLKATSKALESFHMQGIRHTVTNGSIVPHKTITQRLAGFSNRTIHWGFTGLKYYNKAWRYGFAKLERRYQHQLHQSRTTNLEHAPCGQIFRTALYEAFVILPKRKSAQLLKRGFSYAAEVCERQSHHYFNAYQFRKKEETPFATPAQLESIPDEQDEYRDDQEDQVDEYLDYLRWDQVHSPLDSENYEVIARF